MTTAAKHLDVSGSVTAGNSRPATQGVSVRAVCPLCGASDCTVRHATARDVEYCTTDEGFVFHRCLECQVLFIDPMPTDRLGEIYPSNYYAFKPAKPSAPEKIKRWLDNRLFARILGQIQGEALNVLDVGGGVGWLLTQIKQADDRVQETQVVDLDPKAGDQARSLGHAYFHGRFEDYETDKRFDLILLLNLFEHVERPQDLLEKARRLLKPGGVVLIKTPNYDALDARLFRDRDWGGYHCPRHWVLFTMPSLKRLATQAGFRVDRAAYTQGAPFWAVSVIAWMSRRGITSVRRDRPAFQNRWYGPLTGLFAAFDLCRALLGYRTSQMFFVLRKPRR